MNGRASAGLTPPGRLRRDTKDLEKLPSRAQVPKQQQDSPLESERTAPQIPKPGRRQLLQRVWQSAWMRCAGRAQANQKHRWGHAVDTRPPRIGVDSVSVTVRPSRVGAAAATNRKTGAYGRLSVGGSRPAAHARTPQALRL